ncbi:COP1-interacting protein 7 [Amaranthus tricolor]|uniref:COP1-interacting protein 7 n=1 Tax=Amaranthus tricolor TaxID=29722 RepID=UPI00258D9A22|nr:COP1-interacting protein 7 [Amaranthus tricolor]
MKSSTRLDSIVFQLTPTRTRCDLVITANGKSEKIASGLLNPFLAHLKSAEEQIGKGGYSIVLEPKHEIDAVWFTKGTVERFVRFVSSPEILERVYTIESEILQIEKAIVVQNCNDNGFPKVEDIPVKSEERLEGSKPASGSNEEKAIILYQPAGYQAEEDTSITQEKNSKVQLVQVLETRKTVLQKEQGMAFARAVAASFDIDNIVTLLAFAECFGASRMMDACKKFLDLWKAKHESGQWVEVEATEAMSCRSDVPSTNAAGIVFLGSSESKESFPPGDATPEKKDQALPNPHEYSPGQIPHPMFPAWQMHPQANGMPVFPPYSMQGMPYYQNYMGQSPYFQSSYSPHGESRSHSGRKTRRRRHSMDSRDTSAELETEEIDASGRTSDDVTDEEDSVSRKPKSKGEKSSRKHSGKVVIRNINYITSAKQGSSDNDAQSCPDSGTDDEGRTIKTDGTRKLKKKERLSEPADDAGNWQAFQNFLLNDADDNNNSARSGMFEMESKVKGRKRQSAIGDDSSALGMRKFDEDRDVGISKNLEIDGDSTCLRRSVGDQMLSYRQDSNSRHENSQEDLQFMEAGGQRRAYRRSADANMEYMINREDKLSDVWDPSLNPVISNGFQETSDGNKKSSLNGMVDESFMVLQRPGSLDQVRGDGRTAVDMDCELPSVPRKTDHRTYEPNDLNLLPNRAMEGQSGGYDPAMEYDMQAQISNEARMNGKKEVATDAKGSRKAIKDQKVKTEKRNTLGIRREKPSKLSPAEDARARAERLRAYKADLQKLKKEKEEEELRRLEALKLARQKRIAAKSGANPTLSSLPLQPAKRQMPKLSLVSQKGSKFSDTEPGSSSPLQRSTLRFISKVSPDSSKASKSARLNNVSHTNGNRLTRSSSSLRTRKEEKNSVTPDPKASMSRIRRLSEPKGTIYHNSSGKSGSANIVARRRVSERSEIKNSSSTLNIDKLKSSVVSEVKVRVSKTSAVNVQRKPAEEITQKSDDIITRNLSKDLANVSSHQDVDDNPIVEKTVVMLEREKPAALVFDALKDRVGAHMQSNAHNEVGKPEEDPAVPPPASPIIAVKEVDKLTSNCVGKEPSHTRLIEAEKVSPSVDTHKKTHHAPQARPSSLEDPSMAVSDYGKAPPASVERESAGLQTTKAQLSDTQRPGLINTSDAYSGKSQGKESSKGFKRLLMFGKKNTPTNERKIETDEGNLNGFVVDDHSLNGSSSEVFTVKSLLIHEESSSAGTTPKKSSRPFSLLSHFRSKNSEKKLST